VRSRDWSDFGNGGEVVLERVFTQRDGTPAYYLFAVDGLDREALTDETGP
jgi:hypothetical protein